MTTVHVAVAGYNIGGSRPRLCMGQGQRPNGMEYACVAVCRPIHSLRRQPQGVRIRFVRGTTT